MNKSRKSLLRRGILFGISALPVVAMLNTGASANAQWPTSEVNTTGLAVTDDTVTVGGWDTTFHNWFYGY